MKKMLLSVLVVLVFWSAAYGQYSGQLSPAETVLKGYSQAGAYVAVYEKAFGVLGQYRRGVGGYTDFGAKLGFMDIDDGRDKGGAGLMANFDIRYQVMEVRIEDPLDLSIGAAFEFLKVEHLTVFSVGGMGIGAYPIKLKNGRALTPYARLILRVERNDYDVGDADQDFDIGLNLGSTLELSASTRAVAEIQMDDKFGLFMGLEFGL